MLVDSKQLNKFKKLIEADYPDFKIKTTKFLKAGWDNFVVEVNKNYIFRFPKKENFNLNKEIKVLEKLKGKISLKIPVYEFIGKKSSYVGYKKIIGDPLSTAILKSLSSKNRQLLVNDIANFFYEFHKTLPLSQAKKFAVKASNHKWESEVIKKQVIGKLKDKKLSDFIEDNLNKYLGFIEDNLNPVVAYNDLHEENIAFNKKTGYLNGVFDFSDVAVQPVFMEFYRLFSFDQKLTIGVIKKYEKLSGRPVNLERVFISAVVGEGAELGVYSDRPNSKDYKNSLRNLLKLKKYETYKNNSI